MVSRVIVTLTERNRSQVIHDPGLFFLFLLKHFFGNQNELLCLVSAVCVMFLFIQCVALHSLSGPLKKKKEKKTVYNPGLTHTCEFFFKLGE